MLVLQILGTPIFSQKFGKVQKYQNLWQVIPVPLWTHGTGLYEWNQLSLQTNPGQTVVLFAYVFPT